MKNKQALFRVVSTVSAILILQLASAQDVIQKKNGEKINGKVREIGLNEIRYTPQDNPDGPVFSVAKDDVFKILFENGTSWQNAPDPYDVNFDQAVMSKNRALKFYLFSPLFSNLAFGYEQYIKPGMNMDMTLGWIGPALGDNFDEEDPSGAFIKIGPRFRIGSDYKMQGIKYSHHLQGKYLMPQFCFSIFNTNLTESNSNYPYYGSAPVNIRYQVTAFAFNLVYGKQSIIGGGMVFDYHFGVGLGIQSRDIGTDSENFDGYCYSHSYGGPSFPMTFELGIALGGLLK
jgi:hypothetical protein